MATDLEVGHKTGVSSPCRVKRDFTDPRCQKLEKGFASRCIPDYVRGGYSAFPVPLTSEFFFASPLLEPQHNATITKTEHI